ncbi:SDR family oxidoreductase [Rhizobium sp. BK176]|uniref:SDR family oxidoreductase n=1 Tax=Rhizobium sp. BK176 TaxID=2587071 RepID=UPI002169E8CA|nr:SDR family oxidoreductase [Rhizobium sp. BK176]MCS4089358.1 uncharacterized protein YbjT (DUF2867 family) [Rhizobium sp. BK176]
MKQQRVLVLGGYGLIGQSIVRHLLDAGHSVVGLGRNAAHGRRQEPRCDWIAADISRMTSPQDWSVALEGVDAVVNASGALQTGLRDDLGAVQNKSVVSLIEACETAGIKTFVQISAPGAAMEASTEFLRTKAVADSRLRDSALGWVILKPGLVISPNAYGGTALLRMLAAFPMILPVVHGSAKVATVDIDEVSASVVMAVEGTIPAATEMDIMEAAPGSLKDVALAFRSWMGVPPPVAVVELPGWVGSLVGKSADLLGYLGWRSPLRSTALDVIEDGVVGSPAEYLKHVGREPKPLAETLRKLPSTVQERWFAQLYLAMPVAVATLSLFWLASGMIALANLGRAAEHLTAVGMGNTSAAAVVAGGALVDIALGVGALFQAHARKALVGMALVTLAYLAVGTVLSPELWADPLGPYVKTVPAAVFAVIASRFTGSR